MSHEIETFGSEAAFASLRQAAWHGLGTVFDEPVSTAEMLRLAHLSDWNVELVPTMTAGRAHREYFDVVRTNPFDGLKDTLGIVGSRYNVFQNEEMFSFGDNLLHGGQWETAGSLKSGTTVFGSLRLNGNLTVDPEGAADEHERYLLVSTSHDGTSPLMASIVSLRVVCANTLNMALKGTKQHFKIRHSQTMAGKVAAAREALSLAEQYFDAFDVMAQDMIRQEVTVEEARKIVEAVYPLKDKDAKGAVTRWGNKIDQIMAIYNGPTVANVHGTKWGVFNAIEERIDWGRTPRGGDTESMFAAASGFDPVTNSEKNRVLATVASA